jgi:hypothetical protein
LEDVLWPKMIWPVTCPLKNYYPILLPIKKIQT